MFNGNLTLEEALDRRVFHNYRTMTLCALEGAGLARVRGADHRKIQSADTAAREAINAWGQICEVPTTDLFRAFTELTRASFENLEPLILGLKAVVRETAKKGQAASKAKAAA